MYGIYGKEIVAGVQEVDYKFEDMTIKGVIGKPEIARSNKAYQLFFVNKRYVKDKTLASAIDQAFKGLVTVGKFPLCVLNIEMPPNKVDVNVHPAKLEVRFEEEGKVFKAIYHAVKNALLSGEMVREPEKELPQSVEDLNKTQPIETYSEHDGLNTKFGGLFKKFKTPAPVEEQSSNTIEELFKSRNVQEGNNTHEDNNLSKNDNSFENKKIETPSLEKVEKMTNLIIDGQNDKTQVLPKEFNEMYAKTFGKEPVKPQAESIPYSEIKPEESKTISLFEKNENYKPEYKFVGIAFKTYIIIEMNSELYLLDQHAAHERIMYEKVKKNYFENGDKEAQLMLVPDVINLSHKELNIVKENEDMFRKAGFMFEEFGENTIKLTGVPSICIELNTKQLFLDILDEIDTVALTARQEKEDKFLATIACKAAVKAGMTLDKSEVDKIVEGLLVLPNPFTCPHGRPTAIKMSKADLERKFHRR